jgi:hypothetical protein
MSSATNNALRHLTKAHVNRRASLTINVFVSQQCLLSDNTLPCKAMFLQASNSLCGYPNTLPFTDSAYQSLPSSMSINDMLYTAS